MNALVESSVAAGVPHVMEADGRQPGALEKRAKREASQRSRVDRVADLVREYKVGVLARRTHAESFLGRSAR